MSKHVLNTRLPRGAVRRVRESWASGQQWRWFTGRWRPHVGRKLRVTGGAHSLPAGQVAADDSEGCSFGDEFGGSVGPPLALEALYRRESPALLRLLRRRTGSSEDARDLLHDVFVRLARRWSLLQGRVDRPEAFMRAIANNLLTDRTRAAARHAAYLRLVPAVEIIRSHDQERLLESRDALERLEQAMARLKPRTREIFMAHRLDGLSYQEIAERTGLSVKGVEKQMSKAIAQIDRTLQGPPPA